MPQGTEHAGCWLRFNGKLKHAHSVQNCWPEPGGTSWPTSKAATGVAGEMTRSYCCSNLSIAMPNNARLLLAFT